MMLEEMELDGVDARDVDWGAAVAADARAGVPRRGHRRRACRGCSPASACRQAGIPFTIVEKNAGRRRHLVREPLPGLPGRRRQPLLLLLASSPTTTGPSSSPSSPSCRPTSSACMHRLRRRRARPLRHRGRRRPLGRRAGALDGAGPRRRRRRGGPRRPTRSSARSVSSTGPSCPTSPAATTSRPGRCTRPSGARHATCAGKRVAVIGTGASAFQIVPDHRRARSAHLTVFQRSAQWMFPNPNYHEQVGAGRAVGAAPPAVLRPLVPVPAVLAGVRRRPAGHAGRPRLAAPGPRRQRDQRRRPRDVHRSGSPSQVGDDAELLAKVVPDYVCHGQAHPAGQRQLAAAP